MVKKVILSVMLSVMLLAGFVFTSTGSVYAATPPHSKNHVQPYASGGGCSQWLRWTYVDSKACISEVQLFTQSSLLSDGYFNFHNGSTWTSCTVTIDTYITSGRDAGHEHFAYYNCLSAARANAQNVHYGPYDWTNCCWYGDVAHTSVWTTGTFISPGVYSPNVYV